MKGTAPKITRNPSESKENMWKPKEKQWRPKEKQWEFQSKAMKFQAKAIETHPKTMKIKTNSHGNPLEIMEIHAKNMELHATTDENLIKNKKISRKYPEHIWKMSGTKSGNIY